MKRYYWTTLLVFAIVLVGSGPAWADNGPHGGTYTNTTDACAACHRAHRGKNDRLLVGGPMVGNVGISAASVEMGTCATCHGTGTTGADTNVLDGVYENRAPNALGGTSTVGAGLRGGGFVNAVMDTTVSGTPVSAPVTSNHTIGVPGLTIWGMGGSGPGHVTTSSRPVLSCSTCHNPHGFTNADYYRVLRIDLPCQGCHNIHGVSSAAADGAIPDDAVHADLVQQDIGIPDETVKNYTITYRTSGDRAGYRDDTYMYGTPIAKWCTSCHTRYLASDTGDTGDTYFKHRHATSDDERNCLACHVAHGTSARMGTISGKVEWPDGTPGGGTTDSRLLAVDNRGVCYQCHKAP